MFSSLWKIVNWPPLRVFTAIVVALLGIYGSFFYQRAPSLTIDTISSTGVLDVRESLKKLEIIYDGTNLQEKNLSIHVVTIRVSNVGDAEIVKSSYDDAEPFGYRISGGAILETPSIRGERYFVDNVRPVVKSAGLVTFAPVIFNAGDYFDAKTLVLTRAGETPTVSAVGKIAGIDAIRVAEGYKLALEKSYLEKAFLGQADVQVGRMLGYTIATLLVITIATAAVVVPAEKLGKLFAIRRRKETVTRYRNSIGRKTSAKEEFLLQQFVERSMTYRYFLSIMDVDQRYIVKGMGVDDFEDLFFSDDGKKAALEKLEQAGLILVDGPQVTLTEETLEFAPFLIHFLEPNLKNNG